jgi:ADP-ribose pyrophosphatase
MKRQDVEAIEREALFQGWLRLERWHLRHKLFQGGVSGIFTREVLMRGQAVVLLPYDPVNDRVCLIEQFRAGAYVAGEEPWCVEVVAGLVEGDQTPESVARREAEEEAGLKVKRVVPMTKAFSSPGASTECFHFFCGEVNLSDTTSHVYGLEYEHENIRTHIISREEAIAWADQGRVNNLLTLFSLNWLARFGEKVRKEWQASPEA